MPNLNPEKYVERNVRKLQGGLKSYSKSKLNLENVIIIPLPTVTVPDLHAVVGGPSLSAPGAVGRMISPSGLGMATGRTANTGGPPCFTEGRVVLSLGRPAVNQFRYDFS